MDKRFVPVRFLVGNPDDGDDLVGIEPEWSAGVLDLWKISAAWESSNGGAVILVDGHHAEIDMPWRTFEAEYFVSNQFRQYVLTVDDA